MEPQPELLPLYLELIETYSESGQPVLRDYFVLLAAEAYLASGQEDEAEYFYVEFSGRNPEHVLSLAGSLAAAANHAEASSYLSNLRQNYPEDVVRDLVQEARNRRNVLPLRPEPAPVVNRPPLAPTLPVPTVRQNNPPDRGPGNPVPAPRPQPALPRREPIPTPAPPRPQPVPARPAPSGPGPQKRILPIPGLPEEPSSEGIPAVNFFLFLLLVGVAVFLAGWSLILPLLP